MDQLAERKAIGDYLTKRIEGRFESHRQFCRAYLEKRGDPVDDDSIRRMTNRLSQILNGRKEIQLTDLLIFCQLLEISCEDILTAGKSCRPASSRMTNYQAAFSRSEAEWKSFIEREDSPILNADEFGKTFIDYALEANNYPLLKYLMDRRYIWFVGTNEADFPFTFGAGTRFEKSVLPYPHNFNVLNARMMERNELRMRMIVLAIQNQDMEMLQNLHAREIKTMYQITMNSTLPKDPAEEEGSTLLDALEDASDPILRYFAEEFAINDRAGSACRFVFPFLGELIERLLRRKRNVMEDMLKEAILHNRYVCEELKAIMQAMVRFYVHTGYDIGKETERENISQTILQMRGLYDYEGGRWIRYFANVPCGKESLKSNLVRVNASASVGSIQLLIEELNSLYDAVRVMTPNFKET